MTSTGHLRPTNHDLENAQQAIAEAKKCQDGIDGEIEVLMRKVRNLRFKKQQLQDRIDYCKSLITLATRLPPEILAYIFELSASNRRSRAPLILGQVCSSWRNAARYPNVWRYVDIYTDRTNAVELARLYLSKAKKSGLHLSIEIGVDGSVLESVMAVILAGTDQWRTLEVRSLFVQHANRALSAIRGHSLPRLQQVTVNVDMVVRDQPAQNVGADEQLVSLSDVFKYAPNLWSIHLSNEISLARNVTPTTITSFRIDLPMWSAPVVLSADAVINILEGLVNLKEFTLNFPPNTERSFLPPAIVGETIVLPKLVSFNLTISPKSSDILRCFDTPALENLHLTSSCEPLGTPHSPTGRALLDFIATASQTLQVFELRDLDIPSDHLSELLHRVPNLQRLCLHESEITDDVVQTLLGVNSSCPKLRELDFRWCDVLTGNVLVDLVHARRLTNHPIEEITIMNCSSVTEDNIWNIARSTRCRIIPHPDVDPCSAYFFL